MLKFEPVEVLDVRSDVNDIDSGAIVGKYIISQQNKLDSDSFTFYPLDSNLIQFPVKHEIVFGTKFLGKYYYMSKLNIQNSPIANTNPNISSYALEPEDPITFGRYFEENENGNKKLVLREGDTIIQGRFGNSIRLGSNQFQNFVDETTDYLDSPNIKIVSGIREYENKDNVVYVEKLEQEVNSIYLTTKESVSFKYNNEDIETEEPQITIQSDSIVFHGRDEYNVYSPSINLGMVDMQPAVLGNDLVSTINSIFGVIEDVMSTYTPLPSPSTPIKIVQIRTEIERIKQSLNNILSSGVNIS
jgi:hypothetical protein